MLNLDRQRAHLVGVIAWAGKLKAKLGPLLVAEGHRVHFRPTSNGVTMVGLLHHRPQRGLGGIKDLDRVTGNFEALFREHCQDIPQGRGTDEKELQSYLIREAHKNARHLEPINAAARVGGQKLDLVFVTDEIPLPGDQKNIVCDILALRRDEAGRQIPVVVELKSERALTRLLEQVGGYARLVDLHADLFAQLYAAMLGESVTFGGACEKVIVWPTPSGGGPEPRAAELAAVGVTVVGYEQDAERFELRIGVRGADCSGDMPRP
jgi:hypothetical protein